MNKRTIGTTEIEVAPLALGTNVFGWTIDEKTSHTLLDVFVAKGFNLIDTADVYSSWAQGNKGGESETIIGNWLSKSVSRDKIIIATKVGSSMGNGKKGLSKNYILQAVEDSLKRLQTDYIDLYQSHFDDLETPVEETLEAYAQLIKAGKVRSIGASNFTPVRLKESLSASKAKNIPVYQCLQPEYNLYNREGFEKDLEPICRENNMGVICYYSLASGFLTGKYRSEADFGKSARGAGMKKYFNERGFRILNALDEVSEEHNTDPATISLAWLMARPSITAPIASATSLEQLHQLTNAANLELSSAAIEKLNQASSY